MAAKKARLLVMIAMFSEAHWKKSRDFNLDAGVWANAYFKQLGKVRCGPFVKINVILYEATPPYPEAQELIDVLSIHLASFSLNDYYAGSEEEKRRTILDFLHRGCLVAAKHLDLDPEMFERTRAVLEADAARLIVLQQEVREIMRPFNKR